MVLRPIDGAAQKTDCIAVWDAILPTQKMQTREYWLITQADHAGLSGDIAAALGPPLLPRLSPEVVRAVAMHDDGWTPFDANIELTEGRPCSFLDYPPPIFLRAWGNSIDSAERFAPIAGATVSRHFWRLAKNRLESGPDGDDARALVRDFLAREQARQARLLAGDSRREMEFLTDVLQFCDVLSLYLCCGAIADVELPQRFGGPPIRLRRQSAGARDQAAICRFEPSPFSGGGVDLAVSARRYPAANAAGIATLPFVLC